MLRYFDQCIFSKVHSIGPINVCTNFEINRCTIDEFIIHATIVCFTSCVIGARILLKHYETNQISIRLPLQKLWLKQWFSCFA